MTEARQRRSERLARYRVSRQTVMAFCAAEGVTESNFYSWKVKLARSSPKLVPIHVSPLATVLVPEGDLRLELVLPSGTLLRLPTDFVIERFCDTPEHVGGRRMLSIPPTTQICFGGTLDLRCQRTIPDRCPLVGGYVSHAASSRGGTRTPR